MLKLHICYVSIKAVELGKNFFNMIHIPELNIIFVFDL